MKERKCSRAKSIAISVLLTLIFGAIYYYIALPPINISSGDFWTYIVIVLLVFTGILFISSVKSIDKENTNEFLAVLKKTCKIPIFIIIAILLFCIIASIISAPIFHAKAYYSLLEVETGDFATDVAEISYNEIPMLDKDSSVQLGKRALGNISANSDLVSQFEVSDYEYSQINYQNEPVRVAPLKYGNLIKWFNNRSSGLPGYIIVDMVTQEAKLVQLEEGMKYSTSEHFSRNLYRYLRFNYPTMLFGDVNFEIDENGTPWWICSRQIKTIGLFGGVDTKGAVLVNAITGEHCYYEEVPSWVDRVYDADLLVTQYNYHGSLINGWINSWLGQKGITKTTDGYNYIAMNDDVYLYTGVTSAGDDESNVGFILINQRTKSAHYYNITGAEEYSAMSSAEGAVQHLNYTATFPILLNISDEPTYFMALKDSAELVKMYAMVNVSDYQITSTGTSVEECQRNYESLLASNGINVLQTASGAATETPVYVEGEVIEIRSAVNEGNTIFYFNINDGNYYAVSVSTCEEAVIINIGDTVRITYNNSEESSSIIQALQIELE